MSSFWALGANGSKAPDRCDMCSVSSSLIRFSNSQPPWKSSVHFSRRKEAMQQRTPTSMAGPSAHSGPCCPCPAFYVDCYGRRLEIWWCLRHCFLPKFCPLKSEWGLWEGRGSKYMAWAQSRCSWQERTCLGALCLDLHQVLPPNT
jgi:hypothetical protein